MRYGIYYRKCDQKTAPLLKEKYWKYGIEDQVATVCSTFFGRVAEKIENLNCDGNHYVYRFTVDSKQYLFRADTTDDDDEYMIAESAVLKLAASAGIPVPHVYGYDISRSGVPCRWQILEWIPGCSLLEYSRRKELNTRAVAFQLGEIFRKLHAISIPGFGFINTEKLKSDGNLCGLYVSCGEYFCCCLDEHLMYLIQNQLVAGDTIKRIQAILYENMDVLECREGCLIHRDPALWNMIGRPDSVDAIVDWDDAVSGDPADDIGMMHCFYNDAFMRDFQKTYGRCDSDFQRRIDLYFLRNMLWKMVIRHKNGYFERGQEFFLNSPDASLSLYEATLNKLMAALERNEQW